MGVDAPTGVREEGGKCRIRYRGKGIKIDETLDIPHTPAGVIKAARVLKKRVENALLYGQASKCPTLEEFGQLWLNTAGLRPSSKVTAKRHFNKIWLAELGAPPVDEITTRDIRRALATTKTLSLKTRENILGTLRSCLQSAVNEGLIDSNPATGIRPGGNSGSKKKKPPPDPFTLEERDTILEAMKSEGPGRYVYWAIRFLAGARPGETLALTWSDYDREAHQFDICKQIYKGQVVPYTKTTAENQAGRSTYVVKRLRDILAATPRDLRSNNIVCSATGKPFADSSEPRKAFNKVLKAHGIRYRNPYNARHTCATDMLERGIDPIIAADELGNSAPLFLTRYAKWINQDRKKSAYELWEAEL